MNNFAAPTSSNLLESVNEKLDHLMASFSVLAERQQVTDEIMTELVTFFQRFREDTIEGSERNLEEIRAATDVFMSRTNDVAETTVRLTEAVVAGLRDVTAVSEEASKEHYLALRHLAQTSLRKAPLGSTRIRCMFLVHMIESWDAQIDVYYAMKSDPRFDPVVISINRSFPGDKDFGGEEVVSKALSDLKIEHVRIATHDVAEAREMLGYLAPDVIFRQSHWDNDYPPAFSTSELSIAKLCVIPYGMSIVQKFVHSDPTPETVSPMAFDQPYHRSAWRIFCETEQTRTYFKSFQHSHPGKFVLSGYPKHERLRKAIGQGKWPLPDGGGKPFRVIWAPHHSLDDNWLAFGVFHQVYKDMLRWAQSAPDIQFVLKPHPALFGTAVGLGLLSQGELEEFKREWRALPNCAIEEGLYAEIFAASDLMLTDGLSFLTEYQLFDKPLVFIDSQRHVPLNALGQLALECADTVTSVSQAEDTVMAYLNGKPWGHEEARRRLREIMLPNERPSADIIVDAIAEGLGIHRAPQYGLSISADQPEKSFGH
ncbi:hypothetical protein [Agrobacterium sp. SORGH_AS 787]|uniref:hypothetical protein n=1 Tax=Agrobacterium sp. SORGH_AS 787 TaxID=3041775 RepID=UPI002787695C|nr:hypothetical protein [Rhizobium sp. SORGH_AS_0787]